MAAHFTCDGCDAELQPVHEILYVQIEKSFPYLFNPVHYDLCPACVRKLAEQMDPRTWRRVR